MRNSLILSLSILLSCNCLSGFAAESPQSDNALRPAPSLRPESIIETSPASDSPLRRPPAASPDANNGTAGTNAGTNYGRGDAMRRPAPGSIGTNWKAELAECERLLERNELVKAEACAQEALKQIKHSDATADELAYCKLQLAETIYRQDRYDEAIPLYRSSLKIMEKKYGKKSMKVVPFLVTAGGVYEVEGAFKKCAKYYQNALSICEKIDGVNSYSSAAPRLRLARVRMEQGMPKEAEEMYFDCLTILMQQEKLKSSAQLEELLSDYTDALLKSAYPGKALASSFQNELLKDNLASLKQKQGTASSKWMADVKAQLGEKSLQESSLNSQSNSASTLSKEQKDALIQADRKYSDFAALEEINKQRVSFYERLIASDIDSLGADHPSVARDLGGLASIYLSSKNYEQAKPLLKRALQIYQKIYKEDSAPVRQTSLLLDLLESSTSDQNTKIDLSYLDTLPKIPMQAQTLELALLLNDLAFRLYCQGKIETSVRVYNWALASTVKATGDCSLLSASSMNDMSKLLRLNGKAADAEKLENNARAIARQDLLEKRSQLLP